MRIHGKDSESSQSRRMPFSSYPQRGRRGVRSLKHRCPELLLGHLIRYRIGIISLRYHDRPMRRSRPFRRGGAPLADSSGACQRGRTVVQGERAKKKLLPRPPREPSHACQRMQHAHIRAHAYSSHRMEKRQEHDARRQPGSEGGPSMPPQRKGAVSCNPPPQNRSFIISFRWGATHFGAGGAKQFATNFPQAD